MQQRENSDIFSNKPSSYQPHYWQVKNASTDYEAHLAGRDTSQSLCVIQGVLLDQPSVYGKCSRQNLVIFSHSPFKMSAILLFGINASISSSCTVSPELPTHMQHGKWLSSTHSGWPPPELLWHGNSIKCTSWIMMPQAFHVSNSAKHSSRIGWPNAVLNDTQLVLIQSTDLILEQSV